MREPSWLLILKSSVQAIIFALGVCVLSLEQAVKKEQYNGLYLLFLDLLSDFLK